MKLSLEIPIRYYDIFEPYCDFHYALAQMVLEDNDYAKLYRSKQGEIWLDNGFNELRRDIGIDSLLRACDAIGPTHVTALEALDPQENLHNVIKTVEEFGKRGLPFKIVGCFRGGKKELATLMKICDLVALPYDDYRERPLKWHSASNFHFFGFKNLDEVRRHKPKSLDTSVPIRAAQVGIDLKFRERRPSKIPDFDRYATLTKEQLELAILNIKAIKIAGNGGLDDEE